MKSNRYASIGAAGVILIALVACSTPTTNPAGTLVVTAAGGTYANGLRIAKFIPYGAFSGTTVELAEGGSDAVAQVTAQVEAGQVLWDIVACSRKNALTYPEIWEPIDFDVVTATDDLVNEEGVGVNYVNNDLEATILAFRTDQGDAPASWADYFDVDNFPGPRGVPNNGLDAAFNMPTIALLADGVAAEDLIPLDLDRAYEKLAALKPHIAVYYDTYAVAQDMLRSAEMVMAPLTDGRALQLVNGGQPVGIEWSGGLQLNAALCVPKGAPNAEEAMRFLNWTLEDAQGQATFTTITGYGPPTNAGVELAQRAGVTDFTSLHVDDLIPESDEIVDYVDQNSAELLDRWNAFVQA